MPIDFQTCSLPERIEALQERAVPLSSSGRVEWNGGTACDVVVNLTGAPVRLEIDGGLLSIDLPEHGTARDLPPQKMSGYHWLRQHGETVETGHENDSRVFFLLAPADRAPGRLDILQVDDATGRVTCQHSTPAIWVTGRLDSLPPSRAICQPRR